ncbi:hypothetical protein SCHPADRAFT_897875 [Schizopora paradoxa]|uniref:MYND-type domain-containing protein n=1 Tax=Schizopora paradoxa TaxID=27342 RepID=A0A0H2S8J7_9AGAM|nr:hypothetical protein SCHPADRAFT_897875 [Schizopora paradoxa]
MAIRQLRTIADLVSLEDSSEDDKKAIIPPLEVLLILAQDSTLFKILVEGGGLATIFKSAVTLFEGTSPHELAAKKGSNFHVKDFFHNLFTMLKNLSMQIMECVAPISDAIDAGMLRIVAHACDTLDLLNKNTTFFITGILFRFIRLLLVHSSIMLATAREIKRLRTMPCAKKLTSGVFRDEWCSFQDAVLVHYTMLRYREIVLSETQKRRQCDGCQKMDFKDSFQCCGKCKNAFYCSKECQLKSWKGGHKEQCNDLVGSRGKDVVGTKNISYLLALELKRHWPSIQRNPTVERAPFSQLVFDLNWTSMSVPPMKFKVYTIDQLMKKLVSERDFTEISMLKEMQTLTEGSMNALAVTRISVITGYSTRTSYSTIGKTELLSSKLERPADAEVRFTRPVALDADDSDKELTDCIWDEVDEAIHRLGLPKDGSLLVEDAQGKQVHAFTMIDRVLRSPTFPIPMNIRLAKSFEQFKNHQSH